MVCYRPAEVIIYENWSEEGAVKGLGFQVLQVGQEGWQESVRTLLSPDQASRKNSEVLNSEVLKQPGGDQAASAKYWSAEGKHSLKHLSFFTDY